MNYEDTDIAEQLDLALAECQRLRAEAAQLRAWLAKSDAKLARIAAIAASVDADDGNAALDSIVSIRAEVATGRSFVDTWRAMHKVNA